GQMQYRKPPREILEVLDAPVFPSGVLSPTGDTLLLGKPLFYPPISDYAEPQLRLAGVRINPRNNAVHGSNYYASLALKKLPDGAEVGIALPTGARVTPPVRWNA